VIVDLRFNGGGDSRVVKPLLDGLKARPALSQPGHLYALIGPHTFSSGLFAANSFHASLHAVMVGEPVGNKPNHYGEARSFTLPNSMLNVHYSTKHFHMVRDGDPPSLEPDIAVPTSFEDYLAGRDRVLETALRNPLP
jgi:C-terminal processing protease CtpA/Prc